MLFDIPTWIVSISAFIVMVFAITAKENINIKVFALAAMSQFLMYSIFSLWDTPADVRQYMARLNNVTVNLCLFFIILGAKKNNANK